MYPRRGRENEYRGGDAYLIHWTYKSAIAATNVMSLGITFFHGGLVYHVTGGWVLRDETLSLAPIWMHAVAFIGGGAW